MAFGKCDRMKGRKKDFIDGWLKKNRERWRGRKKRKKNGIKGWEKRGRERDTFQWRRGCSPAPTRPGKAQPPTWRGRWCPLRSWRRSLPDSPALLKAEQQQRRLPDHNLKTQRLWCHNITCGRETQVVRSRSISNMMTTCCTEKQKQSIFSFKLTHQEICFITSCLLFSAHDFS